jgi:hypothetical protein
VAREDSSQETLTERQRFIAWGLALFCALSRFFALSRTLWDWDEVLFTMAMRDYDVTLHHPHPPGFPAYIVLGHLARFFTPTDFRALQAVNLIASVLVFPAMFLLARELRFRFSTSAVAATLFAFLPNIWFFGGGAFSDVPSIVIVTFAAALYLRSCPSPGLRPASPRLHGERGDESASRHDSQLSPLSPRERGEGGRRPGEGRAAYLVATVLLAIAIAIRPQNILVGLVPGFLATRKRRWWEIAVAIIIGIVIVGSAFGGAVYATGSWHEYKRVVREHGDYISRVDSFHNPARPPLWRLFDRFFVKQYESPPLSILISIFVLISAVGAIRSRDRRIGRLALMFGPFAIFAWLMLDRFSVSRFSIGYLPLFAILAADGIARVAAALKRASLEPAIGAVLIGLFFAYTFPVLAIVRRQETPPIQALRAVAQHIDPHRDQLFVALPLSVFVDLVLPDMPYVRVLDDRAIPLSVDKRAWLLAESEHAAPGDFLASWPHNQLWNIARRHYFDVKLERVRNVAQFVSGWRQFESTKYDQWRTMDAESVTILPSLDSDRAELRIQFRVPDDVLAHKPVISLSINGRVLDRIKLTEQNFEHDYESVPASAGGPAKLEIRIENAGSGATLQLRYLSWGPA